VNYITSYNYQQKYQKNNHKILSFIKHVFLHTGPM